MQKTVAEGMRASSAAKGQIQRRRAPGAPTANRRRRSLIRTTCTVFQIGTQDVAIPAQIQSIPWPATIFKQRFRAESSPRGEGRSRPASVFELRFHHACAASCETIKIAARSSTVGQENRWQAGRNALRTQHKHIALGKIFRRYRG